MCIRSPGAGNGVKAIRLPLGCGVGGTASAAVTTVPFQLASLDRSVTGWRVPLTREAEHSKRRQALESCLGKLSAPERELVLAPYLHHGRITELAERGGTSANALYKKLGRLRDRLRNCVKERLAHA